MSSDELQTYYRYFYPYQEIVEWLTYNQTTPLQRRELSFQYEGGIVQRYVTFSNAKEFKKRMTSYDENVPRKVDAGAIFNQCPVKDNKNQKPQERELIFDFDMNDYDDVRNCCQGKKVCSKCWKLLRIAIEILTQTLEEDFGFQQFMYVFSGGRGVHIWVCDKRARDLKDSARKAIVDYLELVTGNHKAESLLSQNVLMTSKDNFFKEKNQDRRMATERFLLEYSHPHVVRSLKIIREKFMEIFIEQRALEQQKGRQIIGKILKSRFDLLRERVWKRWEKCPNKTELMYEQLLEEVQLFQSYKNNQGYKEMNSLRSNAKIQRLSFIQEEIHLSFLYPRIDHNVSTMRNHLLKLPFSVHPTSKKISVPIFKNRIDDFSPEECLTIHDLINEIQQLKKNQFDFNNKSNEIIQDSRLYEYVRAMQDFCQNFK